MTLGKLLSISEPRFSALFNGNGAVIPAVPASQENAPGAETLGKLKMPRAALIPFPSPDAVAAP